MGDTKRRFLAFCQCCLDYRISVLLYRVRKRVEVTPAVDVLALPRLLGERGRGERSRRGDHNKVQPPFLSRKWLSLSSTLPQTLGTSGSFVSLQYFLILSAFDGRAGRVGTLQWVSHGHRRRPPGEAILTEGLYIHRGCRQCP